MSDIEWADDDLSDEEYPDLKDDEGDEETVECIECPACGASIYEDSVRCPVCGQYVTFSTNTWTGRTWWWLALGLAGLAIVVLLLLRM